MPRLLVAWKPSEKQRLYTWFDSITGPHTARVAGIHPAFYIETNDGDDGPLLRAELEKEGYTIQELEGAPV